MIKNKLILGSFAMYSVIAVSCADISPKMTNDYKPIDPDNSGIQQLDYGDLYAFPGAQGHGRNTTGGRGGQVYHVTSLADDGSVGTLRWALEQNGTRTVVFDVAGTIHLKSTLNTKYANLTIAGQTSPGGICIADYPFVINSDNVIVRFLRFRLGIKSEENSSNGKAIDADALGGSDKKNVIVDHCSVSWSTDECLSVYGMQNSTVQWCMAYQALRTTSAKEGTHGFGGNWGGHYASYHHNIIAHCDSRVPRLGPRYTTLALGEYVDIRNNVYYNWNGEGCYGGEAQNANIVNNYYKPGPATEDKRKERIAKIGVYGTDYDNGDGYEPYKLIWGKFYIDGNTVEGNEDLSEDNWTDGVFGQMTQDDDVPSEIWNKRKEIYSAEPLLEAGHVTTSSATDAYGKVLELAGACNYRDPIDELIINDIKNGTATCTSSGNPSGSGYINDPQDVLSALSGYADPFEVLSTDTSIDITDTDGDGIPDYWEKEHGLDYQYSSDGNMKTLDVNGKYTNVEMYLNSLVKTIMDKCVEGTIDD